MKIIKYLAVSLLCTPLLAMAKTSNHYWVQTQDNELHTTYVSSTKEDSQIKATLYIGYYNNGSNECENKIRSGTIIFPGSDGFSLTFTKESVEFNPDKPYTCVEEHIQQIDPKLGDKKIISYQLENDGQAFIKATPSVHKVDVK